MNGITFDAGSLIARTQELGLLITIPATVLAQVIRNPARQALVSRLIRQAGTDPMALDGPDSTSIGLLLAHSATSDIADAHVVVCSQRAAQAVITSAPDDLRRIAPELRLILVKQRCNSPVS